MLQNPTYVIGKKRYTYFYMIAAIRASLFFYFYNEGGDPPTLYISPTLCILANLDHTFFKKCPPTLPVADRIWFANSLV